MIYTDELSVYHCTNMHLVVFIFVIINWHFTRKPNTNPFQINLYHIGIYMSHRRSNHSTHITLGKLVHSNDSFHPNSPIYQEAFQ